MPKIEGNSIAVFVRLFIADETNKYQEVKP